VGAIAAISSRKHWIYTQKSRKGLLPTQYNMKVINGKNEGEKYSLEMFMGTKTIHAGMISKQEYCDYKGWGVPDNEDPNEIGYLVAYSDDYVSWSPAVPFQEAYRTNGNLTFGHAIEYKLKEKNELR